MTLFDIANDSTMNQNRTSNSNFFMKTLVSLFSISALMIAGCSESQPGNQSDTSANEANASETTWAGLDELHHLADEVHELVDAGNIAEVRTLAPKLIQQAIELAKTNPPDFVIEPLTTKVLLDDLADLAQTLNKFAEMPDAEVGEVAASFHSLIEQIMHASGSDHDHGHSHSHGDDDHGHDH
jgi:soluble cytochrome b562